MGVSYSCVLGSTGAAPERRRAGVPLCSGCSAGCSAAFPMFLVARASLGHPGRSPGLSVPPSYPGKLGRRWGEGDTFPYFILIWSKNLTWLSIFSQELWSSHRPCSWDRAGHSSGKAKQKRSRGNHPLLHRGNHHILHHEKAVYFGKCPDMSPGTNPGTKSVSRGFGITAVHSCSEQMCPVRSLSGENN